MKKLLLGLLFSLWSGIAAAGVSCSLPFLLQNGTVADANQAMANYNALVSCLAAAAQAGVNSDITSLQGLTVPVPVGAGGTGAYCTAGPGASPQTCNGQRGSVQFTGLSSLLGTGTTQTVVVNSAAITAQSTCWAWWTTAFTAGSALLAGPVVPTSGTLTITAVNAGTTANAVTTGTLAFGCVN